MSRSTRDVYPHANTIVCVEDSKLLRKPQYEVLYEAPSLEAALEELNNLNYFHTYHKALPDNYCALLDGVLSGTMKLLREISPTPLLWRMFALYYDVHNMKLAAKERYWGKTYDSLALSFGSYSFSTIRSAAARPADNILRNAELTKGFSLALVAGSLECDTILDKTYLRVLRALAKQLSIPEIEDFVIARIDLYNLAAYAQMQACDASMDYFYDAFSEEGTSSAEDWTEHMRAVRHGQRSPNDVPFMAPYQSIWEYAQSKEDYFALMDVLIDNFLIQKSKGAKLIPFGLLPICAYFYNKLMEIKNVRILLTCKKNSYDVSEIKKRMRSTYDL